MKFGINQAISQTITQLSCIQLETPSSRLWIFDGSRLTQPLSNLLKCRSCGLIQICVCLSCVCLQPGLLLYLLLCIAFVLSNVFCICCVDRVIRISLNLGCHRICLIEPQCVFSSWWIQCLTTGQLDSKIYNVVEAIFIESIERKYFTAVYL